MRTIKHKVETVLRPLFKVNINECYTGNYFYFCTYWSRVYTRYTTILQSHVPNYRWYLWLN